MYKKCAFFPIAVMISELTVIPINWIWYLRTLGVSQDSLHFTVAKLIRAIVFLLFRATIAPWAVWYALQRYKDPKTGEIQWPKMADALKTLPLPVLLGIATNVVLFGLLNLYWTFGATVAVKNRPRTKRHKH